MSYREEIDQLPSHFRPLSPWAYFGYSILYAIPIIGFISLIVCAFSNANINRRNFARSYFCVLILFVILIAIIIGVVGIDAVLSSISMRA